MLVFFYFVLFLFLALLDSWMNPSIVRLQNLKKGDACQLPPVSLMNQCFPN